MLIGNSTGKIEISKIKGAKGFGLDNILLDCFKVLDSNTESHSEQLDHCAKKLNQKIDEITEKEQKSSRTSLAIAWNDLKSTFYQIEKINNDLHNAQPSNMYKEDYREKLQNYNILTNQRKRVMNDMFNILQSKGYLEANSIKKTIEGNRYFSYHDTRDLLSDLLYYPTSMKLKSMPKSDDFPEKPRGTESSDKTAKAKFQILWISDEEDTKPKFDFVAAQTEIEQNFSQNLSQVAQKYTNKNIELLNLGNMTAIEMTLFLQRLSLIDSEAPVFAQDVNTQAVKEHIIQDGDLFIVGHGHGVINNESLGLKTTHRSVPNTTGNKHQEYFQHASFSKLFSQEPYVEAIEKAPNVYIFSCQSEKHVNFCLAGQRKHHFIKVK
ncbi:MAG: hypothetical protein HRT47_12025 [Candidatus Caenarcaniphilales bacterium]|nr:hypothetical protein [Candidatus Caenarcaniphilales bacterium]